MVIIKDFPNEPEPYWEVEVSGKNEKFKFHYDPECFNEFSRKHFLELIVFIYSPTTGCYELKWQTEGNVFTLS